MSSLEKKGKSDHSALIFDETTLYNYRTVGDTCMLHSLGHIYIIKAQCVSVCLSVYLCVCLSVCPRQYV